MLSLYMLKWKNAKELINNVATVSAVSGQASVTICEIAWRGGERRRESLPLVTCICLVI